MKPNKFRNLINRINDSWLANIVKGEYNSFLGIDIVTRKHAIEVKNKLVGLYANGNWKAFSIKEFQYKGYPEENPDKELYIALTRYELTEPIKCLESELTLNEIETKISKRIVCIYHWEIFENGILCKTTQTKSKRSTYILNSGEEINVNREIMLNYKDLPSLDSMHKVSVKGGTLFFEKKDDFYFDIINQL